MTRMTKVKAYFSQRWVRYDETKKTLRYHRSCHDDHVGECRSFNIDVSFNFGMRPCMGCGAEGHSLLEQPRTRSRLVMRTFKCPVVQHLPYKQDSRTQVDYYVCPRKLVEHYKFDEEEIRKAMNVYIQYGLGLWMTLNHKEEFQMEVLRLCQEGSQSIIH